MAYSRKWERGRSRGFVMLFWELLNSKAYKELTPSAAKALPYFLGKVQLPPKDPNRFVEEIEFSYREGHRMGFANATFSKIIQDLIRFGFIDPVKKGGLRGDRRTSSRFRLSRRWADFGAEKFKSADWKSFHQDL